MKLNDAVVGAGLVVLAAAVGWHVRGFPQMPGQKFGAALFPGIVAAGLALCGALLLLRGARSGQPALQPAAWMRSPTLAGNLALVCGVLVFYVVAADTLGFILCGILVLLGLFLKLGVPAVRAGMVAVIATLVIHTLFYKGLRVPLPWGVLEPLAW